MISRTTSLASTFLCLSLLLGAGTATAVSTGKTLSREEHDRLRYRLETLFNEQDLLVRNEKSDRSDIEHQRREFEVLKVYERIPFQEDLPGLRKSLDESARAAGVKVVSFGKRAAAASKRASRVPDSVYTDQKPPFRLRDEHLVEAIPFRARVEGDEASVKRWIESWPEDQMRLAEPEGEPLRLAGSEGTGRWEVRARAFRFREIKFPTLKARDPAQLLPRWAVKDPARFAREEPLLAGLVRKIRAVSPQAKPLYRHREDLILSHQRMSFFVSKAVPEGARRQAAGHAH